MGLVDLEPWVFVDHVVVEAGIMIDGPEGKLRIGWPSRWAERRRGRRQV